MGPEIIVPHLDGMSDICSPKSSVALFQQATTLDPRTRSPPRASYPGRSVDVRSAWLAVGNSRELGLKREGISGGDGDVRGRETLVFLTTDDVISGGHGGGVASDDGLLTAIMLL